MVSARASCVPLLNFVMSDRGCCPIERPLGMGDKSKRWMERRGRVPLRHQRKGEAECLRVVEALWMIVRESMSLVVLGALVGTGAAWGATRWISSMLFGLSPTDPVTYCAVAAMLVVVAIAACLIPARRAAKVDPMTALRAD
jgi:hypothetical protein